MSQPDSATLSLISNLSVQDIGKKVRVYGRVLAIYPTSSLVLLEHEGCAVAVDLAACLGGTQHLPRLKDSIGVLAHVELQQSEQAQGMVVEGGTEEHLAYMPKYTLKREIVLSAVLMLPANDVDLHQWAVAVKASQGIEPLPFSLKWPS